jgi:hypothetical protein
LFTFCDTSSEVTVKADISNVQALEPAVTGIVCLAGYAKITFLNSNFSDNCASSVVQAQDQTRLNIKSSSFTGSCARESLAPCRSESDYPGDPGGAVLARGDAVVTVSDTFFQGNRACRGGGIFLKDAASLHLSNSSFKDNSALYGADLLTEGTAYVFAKNSTFIDGYSYFAAVYLSADGGPKWNLFEGCTVSVKQNAAITQQGARPLALRNSTITQVETSLSIGGGPYGDSAVNIFPWSRAIVYLQNASLSGVDLCIDPPSNTSSSSASFEQACTQLVSAAALVCIFPNGTALSAHGASHGYVDVCINPNRVSYLVTAYSIFGGAMLLVFASAFSVWVCKKCTSTRNRPAGGIGGIAGPSHLGLGCGFTQELCSSAKGHRLRDAARVALAGYDMASDIVAMFIIRGSTAVGTYIVALLVPIFIASTILHARVCHVFMQKKRVVPPSLWPYKMYSRCHPAVAGVFGWLCPFPVYQFLMHFPTMLLHVIGCGKWYTWLDLGHYANMYSFLSTAIQGPISIGIITAATWQGTSEDLFPRKVTGWVFFFTIASSMASILVWTSIVLSAAVAGEARELFRKMFWDLVVPAGAAGSERAVASGLLQLSSGRQDLKQGVRQEQLVSGGQEMQRGTIV